MPNFFSLTNRLAGIDIGFNTVKVVELYKKGKKIKVSGSNMVGIPPASINKNGFNKKKEIAGAIVEALKRAQPQPIKVDKVVTALPESLIFSKIISISTEIPFKQIEETVLLQVSDLLPWPTAESYFDWRLLPITDPKAKERKIFVAASAKKLVDDLVEIINLTKLNLIAIETKPIAATRALISIKDKNPIIIIDIGAEHSSASVIDNGIIQFASTIPIGANIVEVPATGVPSVNELNKLADHLIENLNNNINYFNTRLKPGGKISQIRLCGGGSNLTGIDKVLESRIKISTVQGNASINFNNKIHYDPTALQIFTVSIGLALRELIK